MPTFSVYDIDVPSKLLKMDYHIIMLCIYAALLILSSFVIRPYFKD